MHESRIKMLMQKSAHDNPSIPKATKRELKFYSSQGLIADTIQMYAYNAQLFPNDFQVHYQLGLILYNSGRFRESLTHYREALKHYTESKKNPLFMIYTLISATLKGLKRFEEALEYVNKSEQVMVPHENIADIYYMRAVISHKLKQYEEEVTAYDQAIALEPTEPVFYVNKSETLMTLGRFKDAFDTLDISVGLEVEDYLTHFLRGYAAFKMGNYIIAKEEYENVELFEPKRSKRHFNMKKEFLDGMEQLEPPNKKQKL
jgi:tetratricopeptide (TPR) repeat protein